MLSTNKLLKLCTVGGLYGGFIGVGIGLYGAFRYEKGRLTGRQEVIEYINRHPEKVSVVNIDKSE